MNLTYIHALYDGLKQAIVRGDMLAGNSAGRLTRLALGTAGTFPRSDGMDLLTSVLILPNAATANRIVYASGSNIYGESANLAFDGTDFTLGSGIRARMVGQNRFRYLNSIASVYKTSAQTGIAVNVWTSFTHEAEEYDTDGLHDTVSNTERITASITGKYLIVASVYIDFTNAVSVDQVGIRIIANGITTVTYGDYTVGLKIPDVVLTTTTILSLAAGEYCEGQGIVTAPSGTFDFALVGSRRLTNIRAFYIGE